MSAPATLAVWRQSGAKPEMREMAVLNATGEELAQRLTALFGGRAVSELALYRDHGGGWRRNRAAEMDLLARLPDAAAMT